MTVTINRIETQKLVVKTNPKEFGCDEKLLLIIIHIITD